MKFSRFLILAAALALISGVALADTVTDPAIGVKGCTVCSTDFGTSQTLTVDSATFVSASFHTNFLITSFLMSFDTPQGTFGDGGPFSTLEGSAFTVTSLSATEALLTGGTILPDSPPPPCDPCITSPTLFALASSPILGGPGGGWNFYINDAVIGSKVTITANPVPEPGTMILLGSGLGALALRRRRKNQAS